jgi:hypothetical protein
MEPKGSSPHSRQPAACSYPELDLCSPCPHTSPPKLILILFSHLRLCLKVVSFPQVTPPNPVFSSRLPIRATYPTHFMRNTNHKALCYVVFSTSLLPHPSWAQLSSSATYSRKLSAYIPTSMRATKFHTHAKKNWQDYTSGYLNLYIFR